MAATPEQFAKANSNFLRDDEYVTPIFLGQDENKIQIGYAYVEHMADGSLDMKMTMIGDYTMSSNNVSGMARIRGFILAELRKD